FRDIKPRQGAAVGQGLPAIGGGTSFKDGAAARFAHGKRQIHRPQERLIFQDHAPLDGVLQLANIARPVVSKNKTAGVFGDATNRLLESAVVALNEKVHQWKDVFLALSQWRNEDRNDGQPVIEILTKLAVAHRLFQI